MTIILNLLVKIIINIQDIKTNNTLFISSLNPIILQLKEALKDNNNAWRIAWKINHEMKMNDKRVSPYIDDIIKCIELKNDGHQRELLKILEKMNLNEKQEGLLFQQCVFIWERIDKIPSVRIKAFQILSKIAHDYPELKKELIHFSSDKYTDTLGRGIKKSFENIMNNAFKN